MNYLKNVVKFLRLMTLLFTFCISYVFAQIPTFNRPANVGDVKIQYLMISYHTANLKDAETDDPVYVELYPGMQPFSLDRPADDREKNHIDQYILSDPKLLFIRDIKYLKIFKKGSNAWAYDNLCITINGYEIYKPRVPVRWLDDDKPLKSSFVVGQNELSTAFSNFYKPGKLIYNIMPSLNREIIKIMIESIVGNSINLKGNGFNVDWGNKSGINTLFGDAVELSLKNNQTLDVDLDLQWCMDNAPNPEYDLNLDIGLTCTSGKVKATVVFSQYREFKFGVDLDKISKSLEMLLSREFNVTDCFSHFIKDGSLIYYRLFK